MTFEAIIGLEVHAELQTRSKMFCGCAVVDTTVAPPNTSVCPVCAGMPGTLPVVNRRAVEMGLQVALALECQINPVSIFARKNYFYPDLPKGYQISQYEHPLAERGKLVIHTSAGERTIRIRRVHLEEDTGKLTHIPGGSLLDLNRAGVPLLEIVSEPDLRSPEEAVAYGEALRQILRYLGVNSGDMEKGVIRFEANVSVRPTGRHELGTRTEVKNLNSFRALERAILFEIERQTRILASGGTVEQETLGWDETRERTYSQRSKEDAPDYRYFPEPDLPPLTLDPAWLERLRADLPELPHARLHRFLTQYHLNQNDAARLVEERAIADYFEQTLAHLPPEIPPQVAANWITGDLFALMNTRNQDIYHLNLPPQALAEVILLVARGEINQATGRALLSEIAESGRSPAEIVEARGLKQVSDADFIAQIVRQTLDEFPNEVKTFHSGKEGVFNWLFGQVMKKAAGKANPHIVRQELTRQLRS